MSGELLATNTIQHLSLTPQMTRIPHFKLLCLAVMLGMTSLTALAGEGHDHGEAPAVASGPAQPRFAATSDLFELVGVLDGKKLALYLDHFADNSPVKDAKLDVEVGSAKVAVKRVGEGEFEAELITLPPEGLLTVTATVIAGNESDLLAGELDIHLDTHASAPGATWSTRAIAGWGAGVIAVFALLFGLRRARAPRAGGAA
jgi:hypothetical protein